MATNLFTWSDERGTHARPLPGAGAPPQIRWFAGLDLGQAADPSALAILEEVRGDETTFLVRHLHRWTLGTPYPQIVADLAALLEREPLASGEVTLMLDKTGVGAAVADMVEMARLRAYVVPIVITGGDTVTRDGATHRVPKRDLVGVAQMLLQTGRLRIAPALPEAETLAREFQEFKVKLSSAGHDSYAVWREGVHDDLALAVMMACWWAVDLGKTNFF
jgi:hypothetical protein